MPQANSHHTSRRTPVFVTAFVLLAALVLPATSLAQATRTWVSGVGDDANPCSRTAPCKTFAGAISKTATGGEIDALDPGGYGTVTITKSITISGAGTNASILASGTQGVVITAPANATVNLIDLNINGAGSTLGTNGVRINSAGAVRLEHVEIFNFSQAGVDFESNSASPNPQSRLTIENSTIQNNVGEGVLVLPQTSVGERATVFNSNIDENGCGISVGGTCGAAAGNGKAALATEIGSTISDNGGGAGTPGEGAGIESVGSTAANIIGNDNVIDNTIGLSRKASGLIISFGDNYVFGNATNGTPSSTTGKTAPDENAVMRKLKRRARERARERSHRRHHRHHRRARHRRR